MPTTLPPTVRANFAERLRLARITRGFKTARSLAREIGIDENTYTRYERAEVEPNLTTLAKICEALEVSASELLEFAAVPDQPWAARDMEPAGAAQAGFREAESTKGGLTSAPLPRESLLRRDAIAWQLAARISAIRGFGGSQGNEVGTPMAVMQRTSALFTELQAAPFAFISRVVADQAVMSLDPDQKEDVRLQIDQLIASIDDTAPSR